jgi:hypothetical protein
MTRSVPDNDRPTTVPARDLRPGQHIMELARPSDDELTIARVEHTTPFRVGEDERVAVTLINAATGLPWMVDYLAAEQVTLATPEQIAGAGSDERREGLAVQLRAAADELHRIADDVLRRRLPVPVRYVPPSISMRLGVVDGRDALERWAEYLGGSVRRGGSDGDIPVVGVSRSAGVALEIQGPREAGGVELLAPAEWAERDGVTVLDADGWRGADWERPIWRPEWERRLSLSTTERRTLEARLPVVPDGAVAVSDNEGVPVRATCRHCATPIVLVVGEDGPGWVHDGADRGCSGLLSEATPGGSDGDR